MQGYTWAHQPARHSLPYRVTNAWTVPAFPLVAVCWFELLALQIPIFRKLVGIESLWKSSPPIPPSCNQPKGGDREEMDSGYINLGTQGIAAEDQCYSWPMLMPAAPGCGEGSFSLPFYREHSPVTPLPSDTACTYTGCLIR